MKKISLFASLLAGSLIAPVAVQAEDAMVLPIKRLTMDTALKMAQAGVKKCRSLSYNVTVTVLDRGGHPQAVLRDTLAPDITLRISHDKAYTAMSFNAATGTLTGKLFDTAGWTQPPRCAPGRHPPENGSRYRYRNTRGCR